MKSYLVTLMMFGLFSVAPMSHAQAANDNTSMEDIQKETQDLLKTIGSYSVDKKDEAVQTAKDGLNEVDKRIDALEAKMDQNWDKMSQAAREQTRENLKALRKQRNQVAEWYGGMKNSTADAWENMKKGYSEAYNKLENAWEKSANAFSSDK